MASTFEIKSSEDLRKLMIEHPEMAKVIEFGSKDTEKDEKEKKDSGITYNVKIDITSSDGLSATYRFRDLPENTVRKALLEFKKGGERK